MPPHAIGLAATLLASAALAAVEGPGQHTQYQARRTAQAPVIDGQLDEAEWGGAPSFSAFVQSFPSVGSTPSERTELKVLYDDRFLYVGVVAYDRTPEQILRPLSRRDRIPTSDAIIVAVDPTHDHRTAYFFAVSAGGVQQDGLIFEDTNSTETWDANWEGAAAPRADGYSVELAIPLHLLRFSGADVQTWGFAVRRELPRTHEQIDSVVLPRDANGFVSRFGHLVGLSALVPQRTLELTPYLAARSNVRPQFSDATRVGPRLLAPSADVGLDFKAGLTSDLTLTGTINPDFGQVEADQVSLNLSSFEQFFPEKRPFFTQGLDLFLPVGSQGGRSPQTLFYSRRIGLDAPILAATKLTGTLGRGWELGALDTVVMGVGQGQAADEERPDQRLGYSLKRPLHVGSRFELPEAHPVTTNYFAAVARGTVAGSSSLGVSTALATPLERACDVDGVCEAALGGNAAAVDWNVRSQDGAWVVRGQVDGSQGVGGPEERVLRDGTRVKRGALGWGTYLTAGKLGGEPWRVQVDYQHASPTLDLNRLGFQQNQNQQSVLGRLTYVRPNGLGFLKSFEAWAMADSAWSTEGRGVHRGWSARVNAGGLLPTYQYVGFEAGYEDARYDLREIPRSGIPVERAPAVYGALYGETDGSKPLFFGGSAYAVHAFEAAGGQHPAAQGFGTDLYSTWRPHPRLETRLNVGLGVRPEFDDYVEGASDPDAGRYVLAQQRSNALSLTLRQQVVLTPRLTVQGYAQLFSAAGFYGRFYEGTSRDQGPLRLRDLRVVDGVDASGFHTAALNLNVVLRWEYRLGSTLYAVYSHAQEEAPAAAGARPSTSMLPSRLFRGPATDAFMVKWSYYWDV